MAFVEQLLQKCWPITGEEEATCQPVDQSPHSPTPPVTLANFAINSQPINCFNFFALSLSASAGIKFYWKEIVKLYWIFSLILAAQLNQLNILFWPACFRAEIIRWEQAAEMLWEVMGLALLTLNRVFARLSPRRSCVCEWWEGQSVHQNYPASRYKQWRNYQLWEIFITQPSQTQNFKWDSALLKLKIQFCRTNLPKAAAHVKDN